MSIQFNDTTNYKGLVQIYEKEIGVNRADISGDSNKLKEFTADCNLALDDFISMAIQSGGTWQFDDSGHSDYPIITTNIVSGQRDYSFTTDGSGNLILDIYRIMIADSGGTFREMESTDQQTLTSNNVNTDTFIDGQNSTGTPTRYDKTANGLFLDPIPNYNYTNGLRLHINREGSYFASSDTTKKPGVPGLFHKYFALKPAMDYARRKSLASYPRIELEVAKMERDIKEYFGKREKDIKRRLRANVENTK